MTLAKLEHIRLLLIDDEDHFRQTLLKRLRKRGMQAREAGSGEEGLAMLNGEAADVVVLDVKMPGLNGIDALKQIKAHRPDTEVIFLTGHASTQDGIEGIKNGAFDYLSKPVEFDHLLEKIKQAFEKKSRAEERAQEAAYKARIEQQMIATERLAALGTLAAGVAHEINNPLAIINEAAGYMGVLINKPELADMPRRQDFAKAIEKVIHAVQRARTITHQLLGSVRKSEPRMAEVDPAGLATETLQLVRKEADNRQIGLTLVNEGDAEATVWIDPNQVRQILINLVTNAIQATAPQGSVTVTVTGTSDGLTLRVSDTGKGIPGENLEKIFEPFFSDKPPGEGTGLGLFVTREIVDKLGGTIEVRSNVGVGSTFTVILPLRHHPPRSVRPTERRTF